MTKLHKPFQRVTLSRLTGEFGPDRDRQIVVTLIPGDGRDVPDLIELRPQGTRRAERVAICDVYRFAIRCRVNLAVLCKARERKVKLQAQRENAAIARSDAKLVRLAREGK